jgi:hypothetical protein
MVRKLKRRFAGVSIVCDNRVQCDSGITIADLLVAQAFVCLRLADSALPAVAPPFNQRKSAAMRTASIISISILCLCLPAVAARQWTRTLVPIITGVSGTERFADPCGLQADLHIQRACHVHTAVAHPTPQLHRVPCARQETL